MKNNTKTYALTRGDGGFELRGKIDGGDAFLQKLFISLSRELPPADITCSDGTAPAVGVDRADLINSHPAYAASELRRRISEVIAGLAGEAGLDANKITKEINFTRDGASLICSVSLYAPVSSNTPPDAAESE